MTVRLSGLAIFLFFVPVQANGHVFNIRSETEQAILDYRLPYIPNKEEKKRENMVTVPVLDGDSKSDED